MISSEILPYLVFHWPTAIGPHLHWQEQSWIYKVFKKISVCAHSLMYTKNVTKKDTQLLTLMKSPCWQTDVGSPV